MSEVYDDEGLVLVRDYLVERGFSDTVATSITLHALLSRLALTVDEIKVSAEEVGYSFTTADAHIINQKILN